MISNDELEAIVYDKLCAYIEEHIDDETQLTKETTGYDLLMDSLDNVEFVLFCEDEFKIEISDESWEKCNTLGEIFNLTLESHPTIDCSMVKEKVVKKVEEDDRWTWGGWW